MSKERCIAIKKDGKRCRAYSTNTSEYCLSHDPAYAEIQQKNRSDGGGARHNKIPKEFRLPDISTKKGLMNAIDRTIRAIMNQGLDYKVANNLIALLNLRVKVIESLPDDVAKEPENDFVEIMAELSRDVAGWVVDILNLFKRIEENPGGYELIDGKPVEITISKSNNGVKLLEK